MAKKFLVPINLDKNALLNATLHPSGTAPSAPVAGQVWFDSANNLLKFYNGSSWVTVADAANTGVTSVSGTANEVTVSGSTGAVTIGLPDSVQITSDLTVGGNLTVSGTTTTVNSETVTIADNVLVLNSNVTGTPTENSGIEVERGSSTNASLIWDETADKWEAGLAGSEVAISLEGHTHTASDVSDFTEAAQDASASMLTGATHSGVSVAYNDAAGTLAITNTGVTAVNGVTGAVTAANLMTAIQTVDGTGSGLDADTLDGNHASAFALSGHNHTVDSLSNVVITANSDNEVLAWDSASSKWTNQTAAEAGLAAASHTHTAANVTDFTEAAQDAVGGIISGSNSLAATYNDASNTITFDTTLATTSYLSKASGLAVDVSALETKLTTDGYSKKYAANVGDGSSTSIAITHSLGSRDVVVNVYDAATYDTVECDVVRTSTSVVTLGFSTAPASNAYRVVVVG